MNASRRSAGAGARRPAESYRHGLASAACEIDQIVDAQTHSVFIVTVIRHAHGFAAPLIAWNRRLIAVD